MKKKILWLCVFILFKNDLYAETTIHIPILPNQKIQDENHSDIDFKNAENSVKNPSSTNTNTEIISSKKNEHTTPIIKSTLDLASSIHSGHVEQYGGENGFLEIHLRGSRAFQPTIYFNGLPLTSAQNGVQNLNLIPASAIGELRVYPDNAPFWLSTMGLGGDMDIISCSSKLCFHNLLLNSPSQYKAESILGSYHYKKLSLSHRYLINKNTQTFETVEWTKSQEDYPVFNNNNSTLHPDVGVFENLQNNDFTYYGGAVGIIHHSPFFGLINWNFISGFRDQGVPSPAGTVSHIRLKENLVASTFQLDKLFPENGIQFKNQLGFLSNGSELSRATSSFSNQGTLTQSYTFQGKSVLILPSELWGQNKTGISLELLDSLFNVHTSLSTNDTAADASTTKANRLEIRPSLFQSVTENLTENITLSGNINAFVSSAKDTTNVSCTAGLLTSCENKEDSNTSRPIYGTTLSVQSEVYFFIPYFRWTFTQRRPYLSEIYGTSNGVLANTSLLNEESEKEEGGIKFPFGELGIFYAKDRNLIFLTQANPIMGQYVNIQGGQRTGFFFNEDVTFKHYYNFSTDYLYLKSIYTQDNLSFTLPRTPKQTLKAKVAIKNISFQNNYFNKITMDSYFSGNYESPFYLDFQNTQTMSLPIFYHAGFGFHFKTNDNVISILFDALNLTDEKFSTLYNDTGYVLQSNSNGYLNLPPPGRRFYVTLSGEF